MTPKLTHHNNNLVYSWKVHGERISLYGYPALAIIHYVAVRNNQLNLYDVYDRAGRDVSIHKAERHSEND